MCRERTGTAWAPQWLAGYQGYNSPSNDRWCSPGDKTWRVLEYRKELMSTLLPKATPKPRIAAKTAPGKAPAIASKVDVKVDGKPTRKAVPAGKASPTGDARHAKR
jgi:hypothetical protein